MNRVSVVIINYNGKKYLKRLADSLNEQGVPYDEVVVVDNNSCDKGYEILLGKLRNVIYIFNEENKGFPAAVNQGVSNASNDNIILLNNDIYLNSDFIKTVVQVLKREENCFYAPLVLDYNGDEIDSAGDLYDIQIKPVKRYSGLKVDKCDLKEEEVDGFSMSACFFKKSKFIDNGSMDEAFRMYFEDVDFSMRARKNGYKVVFIPNAVAYHKVSASTKEEYNSVYSPLKVFYESRNRVFLLKKHYFNHKFFIVFAPFLYGTCTSVLFHLTNTGYFLEYLKGFIYGVVGKAAVEK